MLNMQANSISKEVYNKILNCTVRYRKFVLGSDKKTKFYFIFFVKGPKLRMSVQKIKVKIKI